MLDSLSPQRRRLVLSVLGLVLVAAIAIAAIAVAAHRSSTRAADPVNQDRPGPVLLVPGYGGSQTALDVLAARLRAAGKQVEVLSLPGDGTGDLNAQARTLAAAATAFTAELHAPSLDVVGYSAGGVVARLWIENDGGASIARRVITLGSPHHGTQLASLGSLLPSACPTACQQLASDSDLLTALNSHPITGDGPSYVSIWTTYDDVVLPASSAQLAGALNITVQSVCSSSRIRHSDLPRDPTVESMVLAELAAGPPVPLTSADCAKFSS